MAEEEVALRLDLKNRRETAAGVRDVDSSLGRLDRRTSTLNRGLATLGRTGKKVFRGLAVGIGVAGYAAVRLIKSSLSEAREAQKVGRTTNAILKATGHAAGLTRKEYDKLTKSLMRKTAIDDEQIAMGGNILLTFKKIRREGQGVNDVFGRALSGALDISAVPGFGSLESASKMLGKALNDPVKGMTALNKAGVTFTQDQQDTIKGLVEANDLLGAQKLILKEVEGQVGGTAAAQKTAAQQLDVAWGNVQERIGKALIPVMDDLAHFMLREGIPVVRRFSGWLTNSGVPGLRDMADEARPLAKEVLPAAATAFKDIRDFAKGALPVAKKVVGVFNNMPDWLQKVLVGGAVGALAAKKLGVLGVLGKGASKITGGKGGVVPVFVTNPNFGGPGGKGPSLLGSLKWAGPAVAYSTAWWANQKFPEWMPFGEKGWLNKIHLGGGDTGWLDLFGGGKDAHLGGFQATDQSQKLLDQIAKIKMNDVAQMRELGRSVEAPQLFSKYEGLLKKIPDRIETKFFTPGLAESTDGVNRIIKRFDLDLDRREVKTLYRLVGAEKSIEQLRSLGQYANNLDGRIVDIKTHVSTVNDSLGANGAPDQPNKLPKVDGRVLPKQQPNTGGRSPASTAPGSTTLVVPVTLPDGRVLAEVVVEQLETKLARA